MDQKDIKSNIWEPSLRVGEEWVAGSSHTGKSWERGRWLVRRLEDKIVVVFRMLGGTENSLGEFEPTDTGEMRAICHGIRASSNNWMLMDQVGS